jgi:cardiolipin hydrolase
MNGSFNWTRSASGQNNENVMVLDDSVMIQTFQGEFDRIWKKFDPANKKAEKPVDKN